MMTGQQMLAAAAVLAGVLLGVGCQASPLQKVSRSVSYTNQTVYRCEGLKTNPDVLLDLDIWSATSKRVDVRVQSHREEALVMESFDRCEVMISDVETLVSTQETEALTKRDGGDEWFDDYHSYTEIVSWYKNLTAKHSAIMKFVPSIGQSHEGRDMPAIHINAPSSSKKSVVYFQCQIHAREWISGAVCQYVVSTLVASYGKNSTITNILDKVELVIIPLTNPDGYAYTFSGDRLWRKNRAVNKGSTCRGVDLNRNYPDHWNEGGSSSNPCSETYHGTDAASEPETQHTIKYFRELNAVKGAIDWHAYSELILRPYGHTTQLPPDDKELTAAGDGMRDAALAVHGVKYTAEPSIGLYPTSGGASDWFYGIDASETNDGVRAAGYTIELRDTGKYGFLLPASQIIPNGEEMFAAVVYFLDFCHKVTLPYET